MKTRTTMMLGLAGALLTSAAHAHVAVTTGPATANTTQEVTFSIGHGCEVGTSYLDTKSITIDIPAGVQAVRPMPSDLGQPTVTTDQDGNVTSVTWEKADVLDSDINFYTLTLHLRTPDQPFTRLAFPTHQTCLNADGTTITADWVALPGAQGLPAPLLVVLPERLPGWNRYTITGHMADITPYFQQAQIVWRGNAAYSFNPNTAAQITQTPGVTSITDGLHPGDEIWVKY